MTALLALAGIVVLYAIIRGAPAIYRIAVTQYDERVAELRRAQGLQ